MDRELSRQEIRARRRRTMARIGIPAALAAAALACVIASLRHSIRAGDLVLATVERGEIVISYPASGIVIPMVEEIINSPISSRILEVYHRVGDEVEAGEPLLKLDLQSIESDLLRSESEAEIKRLEIEQNRLAMRTELDDLRMQIEVARMRLSRIEAELRNEQYLDSLGSGTTERVREVEMSCLTGRLELQHLEEKYENRNQSVQAALAVQQLQYEILCRSLDEMRRTLRDARICSPRRAVLTYVNNEIGAAVQRDAKVAAVADLGHFKVDCSISELYAPHVSVGARASLSDGRGSIPGAVTNFSPLTQNGVIEFSIVPDNDSAPILRSGLKLDVWVQGDLRADILRLRKGAYYERPGSFSIFVLEGKTLARRKIILGECNQDWVEVLDGLHEGDTVVIGDMKRFKNINKVKVK